MIFLLNSLQLLLLRLLWDLCRNGPKTDMHNVSQNLQNTLDKLHKEKVNVTQK